MARISYEGRHVLCHIAVDAAWKAKTVVKTGVSTESRVLCRPASPSSRPTTASRSLY